MRMMLKMLPAAVLLALGCEGKQGLQGVPGETGPQGPAGPVGVATASAPLSLSGNSLAIARATGTSDGYLAASDFRAFRTTAGGNLLDWKADVGRWANACGVAPATSIAAADSQEGDTSFEFNVSTPNAAGSCQVYGDFIEIDPTITYYGQVWAKLVGGAGNFYAGFTTYDAAKAPIDNRYFIANNTTLTVGTWVQLAGSIGGIGGGQNAFPAAARFVRPIVNPNFNNIGITRVDGFKVFENARRLPTLYRDGANADQMLPNTDNTCGVAAGSPWTVVNGMSVTFSVPGPTEIELNFAGSMADQNTRTEGLHCGLRYLIDGTVVPGAGNDWGHFGWSTNTWTWHAIGARRRALVAAGSHTVTVQGRSGLCSTPTGSDPSYCWVSTDPALGLYLEVVVP